MQKQTANIVIQFDCVSGTWFSSSVDWFPVCTVDSATKQVHKKNALLHCDRDNISIIYTLYSSI